jgi:hypothetical protein
MLHVLFHYACNLAYFLIFFHLKLFLSHIFSIVTIFSYSLLTTTSVLIICSEIDMFISFKCSKLLIIFVFFFIFQKEIDTFKSFYFLEIYHNWDALSDISKSKFV